MLIQCLEQLIQYFNGQRRKFELPIHQQGSPFQQGVWAELMSIPFGKTISYIELARRIGDTKATRAVASANGKNNPYPACRNIRGKFHLLGKTLYSRSITILKHR